MGNGVRVIAEVLVETGPNVDVDGFKFEEHQGNAVDKADQVEPVNRLAKAPAFPKSNFRYRRTPPNFTVAPNGRRGISPNGKGGKPLLFFRKIPTEQFKVSSQ